MIEIWRYEKDRDVEQVEYPQPASGLLKNETTLLWVDGENPTPEELEWVRQEFKIHPIAMEDYNSPQERARIDRYHNLYSIVFYAMGIEADCRIKERPLTLFVGPQFLITLHADPFPEIKEARALWDRDEKDMPCEIGVAMYALFDTLVDDYFPLIDRLADEVEDVEDNVLQEGHPTNLDRIFHLKRQMLYLRRAVAPERDVLNVLLRRELPIFSESTLIYIQDVYDHIVRVLDSLDTHRDLLSGALDLYVSVTSNQLAMSANRLNLTMQTLASWSIILMTGSLIAGIYGMNFGIMPELHWRFGYPAAMALMLLISLILLAHFRRLKWL